MTTSLLPPVREAMDSFSVSFHDETLYTGPLRAAWAPGRVNLIGEHTDYNGGYVLPLAVDRVAALAGRTRADDTVRLWSTHFQAMAQFSLQELSQDFATLKDQLPGWARYIAGVLTEVIALGITLQGFDAVVTGDVPLGGGMSSSAALGVATAHACTLFASSTFSIGPTNATITPLEAAALCQRAEQKSSGAMVGILDQAASCLGRPHHAVLLDCRSLEYRYLPFNEPGISIVVIDTGVRRELATSAYNERRQQCEEAVALLRTRLLEDNPTNKQVLAIQSLRDITPEWFTRYKDRLPVILQKRAGYIIAENERVLQVVDLLQKGQFKEAGAILWQGHNGLRDEYEVSCGELDTLVELAQQVPGVLGARMMGGGFGGCTINLVQDDAVDALRTLVETQYPTRTGLQATTYICRAAGGPGTTE